MTLCITVLRLGPLVEDCFSIRNWAKIPYGMGKGLSWSMMHLPQSKQIQHSVNKILLCSFFFFFWPLKIVNASVGGINKSLVVSDYTRSNLLKYNVGFQDRSHQFSVYVSKYHQQCGFHELNIWWF